VKKWNAGNKGGTPKQLPTLHTRVCSMVLLICFDREDYRVAGLEGGERMETRSLAIRSSCMSRCVNAHRVEEC
jgi:hypothetical protein